MQNISENRNLAEANIKLHLVGSWINNKLPYKMLEHIAGKVPAQWGLSGVTDCNSGDLPD